MASRRARAPGEAPAPSVAPTALRAHFEHTSGSSAAHFGQLGQRRRRLCRGGTGILWCRSGVHWHTTRLLACDMRCRRCRWGVTWRGGVRGPGTARCWPASWEASRTSAILRPHHAPLCGHEVQISEYSTLAKYWTQIPNIRHEGRYWVKLGTPGRTGPRASYTLWNR